MEAIAATAGLVVVERKPEIVGAEEPLESALRGVFPARIARGVERLDAGSHGGGGLERLLVVERGLATAKQESIRSHGAEVTRAGGLDFHEPIERLEAESLHAVVPCEAACEDQRLRQARVVVGHDVLPPWPVRGRVALEQCEKFSRQILPLAFGEKVAVKRAEIFMQAEQGKRPGAWRGEVADGRERAFHQRSRPGAEVWVRGAADHRAERPESATVAVLGSALLDPSTVESHEIPETAQLRREGVLEKRGGCCLQALDFLPALAEFLEERGED